MAFVIAKNLWSVTRLPFEFALLGTQLTLIRYGLTLVVPPLLGMLAEALFGRTIDRIREAVG
jgi:virulence-associated protein VagC